MRWRHRLACVLFATACTPHDAAAPAPDVEDWRSHAPPSGPITARHDQIVAISDSAQWIAVCRDQGEAVRPRLLVGDDLDLPIDFLRAEDPTGRFVVFDRNAERYLYDAVLRKTTPLGAVRDLTVGSFDAEGTRFVYGERGDTSDRVVVHELARGTTWSFASPLRSLANVEVGRSPRHVWLTSYAEVHAHVGDNMCAVVGPYGFEREPNGHVLALLDGETPRFVEQREHSYPRTAIGDDAVSQLADRIDLVGPRGRQTIVEGDCAVQYHDDDTLVGRCGESDGSHRWWRWRGGMLAEIDFRSTDLDVARGAFDARTLARGAEGAWLSLPTQSVLQGFAVHGEGHTWRDRVVLASNTAVQVRDARDDRVLVEHAIAGRLRAANGPFVAFESRGIDREDGWVIDLRSGSIRAYAGSLVALSSSGHVAQRDAYDGRLRWR